MGILDVVSPFALTTGSMSKIAPFGNFPIRFPHHQALRGHDVLLITIDGSPSKTANGQRWSWQRQIIGAVETVINVRTSSQVYRDEFETKLGQEALAAQGITAHPIPFNSPADFKTPLSWHLTPFRERNLTGFSSRSLHVGFLCDHDGVRDYASCQCGVDIWAFDSGALDRAEGNQSVDESE